MENKLKHKSETHFHEKSQHNAHYAFPSDELLAHAIKRMSKFAPAEWALLFFSHKRKMKLGNCIPTDPEVLSSVKDAVIIIRQSSYSPVNEKTLKF